MAISWQRKRFWLEIAFLHPGQLTIADKEVEVVRTYRLNLRFQVKGVSAHEHIQSPQSGDLSSQTKKQEQKMQLIFGN